MNCRPSNRPRSLTESLKRAEQLVTGTTPFHAGVNRDVIEMANACLTLAATLERVRETDRTPEYEADEARPDGKRPTPEDGKPTRWLTPREMADFVLTPVSTAVPKDDEGGS